MGVPRGIGMRCIATGVVIGGVTCIISLALAADPTQRSFAGKRQTVEQMIDCVKKRVATRTVSYRDAIRACRDAANNDDAANSLMASDARAKPAQDR
ncbi:MAG: hypothetical protein WA642_17495 [Steroidobacteraceae bacterium]